MEKSNISNFTFRDFIQPLFRQKLVILITFSIIIPITYIGLLFQTPIYEAKVLIHIKGVSQIAASTYEGIGGWRVHMTQMALVKSNPVIKRAVKSLELDKRPLDYEKKFCHPLKRYYIDFQLRKEKKRLSSLSEVERNHFVLWKAVGELKKNIETSLEPNTDLFVILVRDYDPQKAIEIANVVSRSYTIYDLQQQLAELTLKYGDLHPTVQQLQDNIQKMTSNLTGKEISDIDSIGTASVKIIEQASTSYIPVGRPKLIVLIIGIIASCFVGLALAFLFDMLNDTFKSPNEIVQFLNIPTLGSIPKRRLIDRQFIKDISAVSSYSAFYNDLADQINIFMKVQNLKTLLLTAVSQQSVNNTVAANLGFCLSFNTDIKTLVIDANIAKPTFHKLFKIEETKGFANIFDETNLDLNTIIHTINDNFHIMQSGIISENSTGLMIESKIKPLIKKLKNMYDGVIIDCTNVKKISDIAMFSTSVDGVILIVNESKDHIQVSRSVLHTLKLNKANIIGGILNNRTFPIPNWLYKRT